MGGSRTGVIPNSSPIPVLDLTPYGLRLGHATDEEGATGCTVVIGDDRPFRAACEVLGRATGTRELHVLDPAHLVGRVDAILLTGGSAYGLDAASGLMRWLEARGRGYPVGAGVVPIVPAAVIYDLSPLGRSDARPTPEMAAAAAEQARPRITEEGSVGAGTGATVGKVLGPAAAMKGGFGAAEAVEGELRVAALAVVNAFGDVLDAEGRILAGARAPDGSFVDAARVLAGAHAASSIAEATGRNTTLAVIAVNRPLPRWELRELARAATGALHRRLRPAGSLVDGDVIFAVSPLPPDGEVERPPRPPELLAAATLATRALEVAVERAVLLARGRDGIPGLADESTSPARTP